MFDKKYLDYFDKLLKYIVSYAKIIVYYLQSKEGQ